VRKGRTKDWMWQRAGWTISATEATGYLTALCGFRYGPPWLTLSVQARSSAGGGSIYATEGDYLS